MARIYKIRKIFLDIRLQRYVSQCIWNKFSYFDNDNKEFDSMKELIKEIRNYVYVIMCIMCGFMGALVGHLINKLN